MNHSILETRPDLGLTLHEYRERGSLLTRGHSQYFLEIADGEATRRREVGSQTIDQALIETMPRRPHPIGAQRLHLVWLIPLDTIECIQSLSILDAECTCHKDLYLFQSDYQLTGDLTILAGENYLRGSLFKPGYDRIWLEEWQKAAHLSGIPAKENWQPDPISKKASKKKK